jgi:hypothetical protein
LAEAGAQGRRDSILLVDACGPAWDPWRDGGEALTLARHLASPRWYPIVAVVVPGLGGIWTDVIEGLELIRFGYPDKDRPRDFDPLDSSPRRANVFVRHWERIVFARSAKVVLTLTGTVAGPLSQAIAGQDTQWWGRVRDWADWSWLMESRHTSVNSRQPRPRWLAGDPEAGQPPHPLADLDLEFVPAADLAACLKQRLERLP